MAAEYYVLSWKAVEVAVLMLWRVPEVLIPNLTRSDVAGDAQHLSSVYCNGRGWPLGLSVLRGVADGLHGKWVVGFWLGKSAYSEADHAFLLTGTVLFVLNAHHRAVINVYSSCDFRAAHRLVRCQPNLSLLVIRLHGTQEVALLSRLKQRGRGRHYG